MPDTVIRVENLAKRYRLGVIGATALHEDLSRWWARMRGRPDPTLRVTEVNERTQHGHSDYVWALRDVNFDVRRGEVVGIIGRNGAGKSTLLKILSRVTAPTEGVAKLRGRVGSLLEVGTGFHAELTGRENVLVNGAILGMTRAEVLARMEEIVAFSGCERYIDTPVKRYSSGMTVRLGFAVAAHLDPEILIVDEVLAVGDAEFQRKCLGKMQDVAGQGRTVLFVSHNMGMIDRLCGRCLLIDRGGIVADGATSGVIQQYFRLGEGVLDRGSFKGGLAADIQVTGVSVNGVAGRQLLTVSPSQDIAVTFRGTASRAFDDIRLTLSLFTAGLQVVTVHDTDDYARLDAGAFESTITIPRYLLRPGEYAIGIGGLRRNEEWFFGRNLAHIRILEEWDAQCDYSCAGILNLPHRPGMGRRRRVAATEGAS